MGFLVGQSPRLQWGLHLLVGDRTVYPRTVYAAEDRSKHLGFSWVARATGLLGSLARANQAIRAKSQVMCFVAQVASKVNAWGGMASSPSEVV